MIRSLHRRFLWYAYLWACVFVLIVMLVTLGSLAHYIDGIIADTLMNTLRLAESDPDSTVTSRSRLPSYLVEVQQASVDLYATKLADGDALVFLRGERNDWSEEEIRDTAEEMLESTRKIGILRHDSLCYAVDRSGPVIRIAAVEYDGYRAFLLRIVQWGMLLYTVICGALFLLLKLAEIRLLRPAERAWELQERFVGDASHEMKTPLAIILSNAELGVSEQDSIFVGDSYVDAQAAQEVGMDFAAVLYGLGFRSEEETKQYENCKACLRNANEIYTKLSNL